jgi:hypothetical protein
MDDFNFGFGKGRYLRGRGWRGVLALALLLWAAVLASSNSVVPFMASVSAWILHFVAAP